MFGRYELLDTLGEGGMAEVYLARIVGPQGVDRLVALKRIRAALAADRDQIDMFVDEARVASRLSHPSIVCVQDFGIEAECYYLAMEWVDGVDMARVMDVARASGEPLPVEAVLYIGSQVARALAYAHRLRDADGTALEIVHRDVSPSNILVSFDGAIKLADFGIARASERLRQLKTEAGVLKGKIAYMSPEQARGEEVDARSDLFSLGTVLLEALTLERAFAASSDMQSLRQVQSGVPLDWEAKRKLMPDDVRPVIERALAPQRDDRYRDGDALADALAETLGKRQRSFSASNLVEAMAEHLEGFRLRANERRHIPSLGRLPAVAVVSKASSEPPTTLRNQVAANTPKGVGELITRPRIRAGAFAAVALTGAVVAAVVWFARVRPVDTPVTTPSPVVAKPPVKPAVPFATFQVTTNASAARVFLDRSREEHSKDPVAAGGSILRIRVPAGDWFVRVEADGFQPGVVPLKLGEGEETSLSVPLVPIAPTPVPVPAKAGSRIKKPATAPPTTKPGSGPTPEEPIMNPF
jgi:eukaryotic-like serine/threonine-protein kinase